jgi:uncharacterized protein (TIGR03089 family)
MHVWFLIVTRQPIAQALDALLRQDSAKPFITQIWADGQRVELSVRTFENNVAKAANLLQEEFDADAHTTFLLKLPLHWQASVWLTAVAMTGSSVRPVLASDSTSIPETPGHEYAAAFVDRAAHVDSVITPTYVVSLHPLGLPEGHTPPGTLDLAREIRGYSDVFIPSIHGPDDVWLHLGDAQLSQQDALARAESLARSVGLDTGGRLLIQGAVNGDTVLAVCALPFSYRASVVICPESDADIEKIAAIERCTAVLIPER